MMSWTVFWIHPTNGGPQISVAVTSMLTLIAYRFAIGSEVPKLPYLTRLDAFILASSLLVFLSLIEVMLTTKNSRLTTGEVLPRSSTVDAAFFSRSPSPVLPPQCSFAEDAKRLHEAENS